MTHSRARVPTAVVDAAAAVATAVVLVGEVVSSPTMAPRGPLLAAVLVVALAVGAWRVAPGAAAVLASLGVLAAALLTTSAFPPQVTVVPLLLLLFNAASRLRGPAATGYAVATLALVVAGHLASPDGDAGDFWPWLLWALAWGTGLVVRRRTDAARTEAARAALFEVEARTSAAHAAQRERERIARELHDVVAHAVSVMVVQAGAERLRLGEAAGETGEALSAIEGAGRQALGELRMLLGLLAQSGGPEEDAQPLPRLSDVPALVQRLRDTGLPVDLELRPDDVLVGRGELPDALELAAYRIVQESLTNVVRHAGSVPTGSGWPRRVPSRDLRGQRAPGSVGALLGSRAGRRRDAGACPDPGGGLTAERQGDRYVVTARLPLALGRGVRP